MSGPGLPEVVRQGIEEILALEGDAGNRVTGTRSVGGGCINRALVADVDTGPPVFVKWHPSPPAGFFEAEVDGLQALREKGGPRAPRPLGHGEAPGGGPAWLVLEYLEPRPAPPDFGQRLGEAVAELHEPLEGESGPGWHRDNFIGSLPQRNTPKPDWPEFWRSERLGPQLRTARDHGHLTPEEAQELDRALARVDELLGDVPSEGISLVHGDLWSGNVHVGPEGEPVLLDPAVYRGHREVDLAMADLFGGFPPGFEEAYREALPVDGGYEAVRRDLYQLYPLLVHVNLFGRGYAANTLGAARRVVEASR